jgi:hypothetical protein
MVGVAVGVAQRADGRATGVSRSAICCQAQLTASQRACSAGSSGWDAGKVVVVPALIKTSWPALSTMLVFAPARIVTCPPSAGTAT